MEDDGPHYPPGAEPETPAIEVPQPAEKPVEDKAPEPEAEKPEEKKPEEQPEPEGDAPAPETEVKKRSIYDDLKDRKQQAKEATARAEVAEARAAELEALLAKKDEADSPAEKKEAKDAIDEWADKQGLDGKAVRELSEIIKGSLPKPEGAVLTPEEAAEWRAERARSKATAEDQAVLAEAPSIRKQLEEFKVIVHDEAEFQSLMQEVVKLSHTKEFHDKSVDYIVFRNRDALSKLISPKKPSFEQGGQRQDSEVGEDTKLSSKATPMQAQEAIQDRGRAGGYDIRQS